MIRVALLIPLCCGFVALPIQDVANRSRTDRVPDDGKGGWLDLGANNLGVLPSGRQVMAGVPFEIPPDGDENARNCIVLGRTGPEELRWTLPEGVSERRLYLLHARGTVGTPAPETVGEIVLGYADGSSATNAVRTLADVADWMSGRGGDNAARAWSEYNGASQASMYVSSFGLKENGTLASVTFRANGTTPWMIAAASAAERLPIRPLGRCLEVTDVLRSPEAPRAPLVRFKPGLRPRNIILIIGDGMGQGAARITSYYKYGIGDGLFFNRFPVAGLCATVNVRGETTDSSAAATAFATGTKTANWRLGLTADCRHSLTSVATRAKAAGLGVALVTSDSITGATPAGFYAHVPSRSEKGRICEQALESGFDVLIGRSGTLDGFRAALPSRGYVAASGLADCRSVPGRSKVIGETDMTSDVSIAEAMEVAFARLKDGEKGFFMMAECADTDGGGHRNDPSRTVRAVTQVEFMAKAAVDFALRRGDTLVIVTADHETGGALAVRSSDGRTTVDYMTTSHTSMPVPLHAYGPGAERFEGLIDNTDIAKNVAVLLGLP